MRKLTAFILPLIFIVNNAFAQNWFPLGAGAPSNITNGPEILAVSVYNNELIIGGYSNNIGGLNIDHIGKWNGISWSAFPGTAFNSTVYAIIDFNNQLIVGGRYPATVSKWNSTAWSSIAVGITGGSMTNSVNAFVVFNGSLIAAGNFTNINGVSANNIAKWDGSSWSSLGSGIRIDSADYDIINALYVYNNELYVGGYFDSAGSVAASNIAKWNGTSWSAVGGGTNYKVHSLTVFNNELIAGGYFTTAGGISASHIAKWNGSSWSALGSGTTGFHADINCLYVNNNALIAGGNFTTIGGINANRIASWNGSSWSALGTGINVNQSYGEVWAITKFGNDLIVGGDFINAGIYAAFNVAKWGMTFGIKQISSEISDKYLLEQNYPNPFNPSTNIRYQIKNNTNVILKIYDISGKEIITLVNEKQNSGTYEVTFDGSELSSGVYYYKLTTGDFSVTKKMILIK
jgi:hypothetical protein